MAKMDNEKRAMKVREFIANAKDEFKKLIPRDKIDDVSITELNEKDGAYAISGSVGTISPTGKLKTFRYSACVKADEEGNCTLDKLSVSEL